MSRTPDPPHLDQQLCFAIYATGLAFNAAYKPFLDPLRLTYPQYLVMLVLWEKDGINVREIGAKLHLDSGTLTPLLKRLEAAGYIRRQRDPSDERQLRVELTQAGRVIRGEVAKARENVVCALGGSEEPIQALKAKLDEIIPLLKKSLGSGSATEGARA